MFSSFTSLWSTPIDMQYCTASTTCLNRNRADLALITLARDIVEEIDVLLWSLHHHVAAVSVLEIVHHLYYVLVFEAIQESHLFGHHLLSDPGPGEYFGLWYDFDGHWVSAQSAGASTHRPESSLSNDLSQFIMVQQVPPLHCWSRLTLLSARSTMTVSVVILASVRRFLGEGRTSLASNSSSFSLSCWSHHVALSCQVVS